MKNVLQKAALIFVFCTVLGGFGLLSYVIYKHNNPEIDLAAMLIDDKKQIAQAFFSPDDDMRNLLVALINAEKKSIAVAIYTLTDKVIAQAFIRAHKRGVKVQCVADPGYGDDRYSKIAQLANESIPVWIYQSSSNNRESSLMHNKFCIFEDNVEHHSIVWTGSFNFTVRAYERNQENVVVLDNERIVEKFKAQFELLKKRSLSITS